MELRPSKTAAYHDWQVNFRERADSREAALRGDGPKRWRVRLFADEPVLSVSEMKDVLPKDVLHSIEYRLEKVDTVCDRRRWTNFVVDIFELQVWYTPTEHVVVWVGGRRRYR